MTCTDIKPRRRSIIYASTTVLEHILCHEQCDVDLQNKLQRDTPLHLAVRPFLAAFPSLH